jgi:hypothetical protein
MEKEDLFKAEAVVSEVDAERGGGGANLEGVSSNIYLCMYMYMYMYYGRDRDQGGGGAYDHVGGGRTGWRTRCWRGRYSEAMLPLWRCSRDRQRCF